MRVALLKASLWLTTNSPGPFLLRLRLRLTANFDQDLGVTIILCALITTTWTILPNAGEEASAIVDTLLLQCGISDTFSWGCEQGGVC